jgi:sortase A
VTATDTAFDVDLAAVAPRRARRQAPPTVQVITTAITLLSVVLLGFAVYIGFVARLHHDRAQLVAYANFRKELALGTAPTGQTKPTDPNTLLDMGTPIAVLSIPKVGLNEVVFEGTTGAVLEKGPGHLRETPLPGQAGVSTIMGRATMFGGPFGKLASLMPGDMIRVTTGQGVHDYTVLDIRKSGMPSPPQPAAGKGRLVLTTAYGGPVVPSDVLRVDADLTTQVQDSARLKLGPDRVPHSEQVMAIDTGAWFPMVFVGEALVMAVALISVARVVWGNWQAWLVAVPVIGFLGLATADQAARLLPNLM